MERIPFYSLHTQHSRLKDRLINTFNQTLEVNRFVLGDSVQTFESEFAAFHSMRFCVGVGNGLDAVYLSLKAIGVGPGDEVIVPAHTFVATWLAVSRAGATPVPVDVDATTWLIDPSKIEAAITKKTRAIVPVHLYGMSCEMEDILGITKKHSLKIIEDCAQSCGAMLAGKKTGTFGSCGAFSFYPTKNLGALGDGGAILTNDESVYAMLRRLRNYGQEQKYQSDVKGDNSRLDEMQAAFLSEKLKMLEEWNQERASLVELYRDNLSGVNEITLQQRVKNGKSANHIFPVLTTRRDELAAKLSENGIETVIHYPLLPYQQRAYSEFKSCEGNFPVAEKIAREELSLPLWPGMKSAQVNRVCDVIRNFYR